MRAFLIAMWLALSAASAHGQTFREWFRQNSTQRQYLKEQILQLKLYLELTKDGYKIAKDGLGAIHQIKATEFKLHKDRFDSLLIVKPSISSLSRLQHITDLHKSINDICANMPAAINACLFFDTTEKTRLVALLKRLYDDSQVLIGGFFMVVRDKQVLMADQERVSRIEQICQAFQENYLLAKGLQTDFALACNGSNRELEQINSRRVIQGLK